MIRGTKGFEIAQLGKYWWKTLSINGNSPIVKSERISYGNHRKQYLILFSPPVVDASKPLILYYHGGGWIFGKPELFIKKAELFTRLGFQVVMPCYRKLPQYTADEIIDDVVSCSRHLHILQKEGKIANLNKIILGGVSAGANLISLFYFNKSMHKSAGFNQDQFKGMFLYAPPLDLNYMKKSSVLYRYAGNKSSTRFQSANPIEYIENNKPIPILCAHGDRDAFVPLQASASFRKTYENLYPGHLKFSLIENGCHLDAASWAHSEGALRTELVDWLSRF